MRGETVHNSHTDSCVLGYIKAKVMIVGVLWCIYVPSIGDSCVLGYIVSKVMIVEQYVLIGVLYCTIRRGQLCFRGAPCRGPVALGSGALSRGSQGQSGADRLVGRTQTSAGVPLGFRGRLFPW